MYRHWFGDLIGYTLLAVVTLAGLCAAVFLARLCWSLVTWDWSW